MSTEREGDCLWWSAPLIHSDMRSVQDIQQDSTALLSSHPEESLFSSVFTFSIHIDPQFTLYILSDMLVWTIFMEESLWDEQCPKYYQQTKSALLSPWRNTADLLRFKTERMLHVHSGHTLWFSKNTLHQIIFHIFLGVLAMHNTTTTAGALKVQFINYDQNLKVAPKGGQHVARVTTNCRHYSRCYSYWLSWPWSYWPCSWIVPKM